MFAESLLCAAPQAGAREQGGRGGEMMVHQREGQTVITLLQPAPCYVLSVIKTTFDSEGL